MASLCVPCFSRIIITTPGTFKKSKPDEIYAIFAETAKKANPPPELLFIPNTKDAVDMAINLALKHELPVLGAGSFYLTAEIRKGIRD